MAQTGGTYGPISRSRLEGSSDSDDAELGDWVVLPDVNIPDPATRSWFSLSIRWQVGSRTAFPSDGNDNVSRTRDAATSVSKPSSSVAIPLEREMTIPSRPTDQQEQCNLFHLPAELRLRIYHAVFSNDNDNNNMPIRPEYHPAHCGPQPTTLSLLQTCRRINHEAETIYYAVNTFELYTAELQRGLLQTINPRRRNALRSVRLHVTSAADALTALQRLQAARGLVKIEIWRHLSVRYTDVRSWAVLRRQLKEALETFDELRQVSVFTPPLTGSISREEELAWRRLVEIDAFLQGSATVSYKLPGDVRRQSGMGGWR